MDATGLTLMVVALVFLCWLLAPSSRRAKGDTDAPAHTHDGPLATGSSPN